MAKEPYTLTNQKLYFAKQTLNTWQQNFNSQIITPAQEAMYYEQSIFHLYGGLWALSHEIASAYQLALPTKYLSIVQFLTEEWIQTHPAPELMELANLITEPQSALYRLVNAWDALFQPVSKTKSGVNRIATTTLDEGLSAEVWQECLTQLTDLVKRFRDSMTEY